MQLDLGGRVIDCLDTPGHHEAAVTYYDRYNADPVHRGHGVPGRLYVFDWPAFVRSVNRLVDWSAEHPVSHVLGCHIEMTTTPGQDYPIGWTCPPDGPPLAAHPRASAATSGHHPGARRQAGPLRAARDDHRPALARGGGMVRPGGGSAALAGQPLWRRRLSASARIAAPSASLRRSFTYARWVLYGSARGGAGGSARPARPGTRSAGTPRSRALQHRWRSSAASRACWRTRRTPRRAARTRRARPRPSAPRLPCCRGWRCHCSRKYPLPRGFVFPRPVPDLASCLCGGRASMMDSC